MIIALALAAALPSAALQSEIKAGLEAQLKDGQSARIIWQPQHDQRIYCGFVNAKNSFGAYAGYRLFYIMPGPKAEVSIGGLADLLCKSAGYKIEPGK